MNDTNNLAWSGPQIGENWHAKFPRAQRLSRKEAHGYLKRKHGLTVAVATLAKLASVGGGPRYQKFGRKPLYPTEELDRWAEGRLGAIISNTSQHDGH